MADHTELRVHGVSGTPPRDMLYTDPEPRDPPTADNKYTRVYEKPGRDAGYRVQGFHWGGLTSGDWRTAFWIILSPFVLANVAGWTSRRASKIGVALVRVTALALTALFVSQALVAFVLIPHRWLLDWLSVSTPTGAALVTDACFLAVTLLFLWLVHMSAQSHFVDLSGKSKLVLQFDPRVDSLLPPDADELPIPIEEQWEDPAPATLEKDAVWYPHAILHRLRRLHLAVGLATISIAIALAAGAAWLLWLGYALFAVLVVLTFVTVFRAPNRAVLQLTAVSPPAALALTLASLVVLPVVAPETGPSSSLHVLTFGITVVLGVSAMASVFTAGLRTVGALVIASQFGAVLGIAVGLISEQVFVPESERDLIATGAGFVAVAMLFLMGLIAVVALVLSAIPHTRSGDHGGTTLLRRIVLRGKWVFYFAAFYGIAFGVVVLSLAGGASLRQLDGGPGRALAGFTPDALGDTGSGNMARNAAVAVALVVAGLLWWRVWSAVGWKAGLLVPAATAASIYIFKRGMSIGFFGVEFSIGGEGDAAQLPQIAAFLTVLIPGIFLLKSIITGVRQGESKRRQVGILWDIGCFWPRWFHPLAPPGYGPIAVKGLQDELNAHHAEILAAHSQGTLVSAVAVSRMDDAALPGSLITYGSQLGLLYPQMFPAAGIGSIVDRVSDRLGDRWINLWRDDDPIGGQFIESLGPANWRVCTGHGHSRYEITPEYGVARSQVVTGSTAWPGDQAPPPCWPAG